MALNPPVEAAAAAAAAVPKALGNVEAPTEGGLLVLPIALFPCDKYHEIPYFKFIL